MPASTTRLSLRRRRSSLSLGKSASTEHTPCLITPVAAFHPAKAGIYGIASRPVTFAPNVTPISYHDDSTSEPGSPTSVAIFPPSETPAPPPARRRCPPGKRRSLGYIPRPPNAFMLFRADFVRQKHVPGTIETNHGSLSKIIGNCWRALPLDEKKIWEVKAKHAKAEHKIRYPEYRFKPVHNKHKNKDKKEKPQTTIEDERRCEEVAQLLLEGKKGDELAAAVRDLDLFRSPHDLLQAPFLAQPQRQFTRARRPSSVPLPNDYYPPFSFTTPTLTLPTPPFLSAGYQPEVTQFRNLGARRPSSARPYLTRSWIVPGSEITVPHTLERDDSPLPEVDASLWDPSFHLGPTFPIFDNRALSSSSPSSSVSDLSPHDLLTTHHLFTAPSAEIDPLSWMSSVPVSSSSVSFQELFQGPTDQQSYPNPISNTPSSTYSPAPLPSMDIMSNTNGMEVFAPKPQSATSAVFPVDLELWKDLDLSSSAQSFVHVNGPGMDMGLGVDMGMGMYPKTSFDVAMQALGAYGGNNEGVPMVGVGPIEAGFGMEMEFDPGLAMF